MADTLAYGTVMADPMVGPPLASESLAQVARAECTLPERRAHLWNPLIRSSNTATINKTAAVMRPLGTGQSTHRRRSTLLLPRLLVLRLIRAALRRCQAKRTHA